MMKEADGQIWQVEQIPEVQIAKKSLVNSLRPSDAYMHR